MSEKQVAIIGVGNILCQDDGVGVHVIQELQNYCLPDNVTTIDAGTDTFDAFLDTARADKVVVIDAVKADGAPGDIYRFPIDDISTNSGAGKTSVHQISLHEALSMARLLSNCAPEVVVIGVEPESVYLGEELSPNIQNKLREIVELVLEEAVN